MKEELDNTEKEIGNRNNRKGAINGSMKDKEYFEDRLEAQIEWHSKKASENKKKYQKNKTLEFILAASIPVTISLSALGVFEHTILFSVKATIGDVKDIQYPLTLSVFLQILVAAAGIWLAIVNKKIELEEYYKNWKEFRSVEEHLRNHKIMYLTGSVPYDGHNAYSQLVENTESILSQQIMKWQQSSSHSHKLNDLNEKAFNALDEQQASWGKTGKATSKSSTASTDSKIKSPHPPINKEVNKVVEKKDTKKKSDEQAEKKDEDEIHG